jgi:hypothetical protein
MQDKPLIIYIDDDGEVSKTYSDYELGVGTITFITNKNKITIPISKLVKIKEEKDE